MERRDFLKYVTAVASNSLLLGVLQGCKNASDPQNFEYTLNSENIEYYFQVNLFGSPARWTLDSFLKTKDSDNFRPNKMIGTVLNTKAVDKYNFPTLEYVTVRRGNYQVPYLWSLPIKIGDKSINIDDLLNNMITIRGCDMGQDGHELNNRKLVAPIPGEVSLTGAISDISERPIPVVHLVGEELPSDIADSAFKAKFSSYAGTVKMADQSVEEVFKKWFSSSTIVGDDDLGLSGLPKSIQRKYKYNSDKAKKLIDKSFDEIFTYFKKAKSDYQLIIDSTFKETLKGINDFDTKNIQFPFYPNDGQRDWDLKWLFAKWRHEEDILLDGWDKAFKNAKWNNLANQFAMTQALTKFEIIQSSVIIPNSITDIFFDRVIEIESLKKVGDKVTLSTRPQRKDVTFEFDSHNSGSILTLVANSYAQRALMGCIHYFTDFLKNTKIDGSNLYNKSLIHMTSEFEREPATSQMGSEHGWNGHCSTFFSGAIDKTQVIGNILTNPKSTMYKDSGTWGAAAPMKSLNGRTLEYGNISSTIAKLIGVPSPTSNRESLLEMRNGKIEPITTECKNI